MPMVSYSVVVELRKDIDALKRRLADEEAAHSSTIDQRDRAEGMADKLAQAIGSRFRIEVGEHSNMSCPWEVALDVMRGNYLTDSDEERTAKDLRTMIAKLTTWQPMDTVPKDGTPVLVLLPKEKDSGQVLLERIQHAQFVTTAQGSIAATIGDYFEFDKPKPIGWMLPPPIPATELEGHDK